MSSKSANKGKGANGSNKAQHVDLTLSESDDDGPTVSSKSKSTSKPTPASSSKVKPKAASTSKTSTPSRVASSSKAKRKVESESEDEEDVKPAKKRASTGGAKSSVTAAKRKATKVESDEEDYDDAEMDDVDEDEDEEDEGDEDDDDDEEEEVKPARKGSAKKAPAKKPTPSKAKASTSKAASTAKGKAAAKKEEQPDDDGKKGKQGNGDGVGEGEEKPKFKWQPKVRAGPSNPGGKTIPEGAPDCLAGLTIVFTGELETIGRDESITLAKRYGAKVTTSVSSKTSYVVLGTDAGPSKLKMIKQNKIATLDEDGFLNLIATRGAKDLDKKYIEKQEKEEKAIKEAAKSIKIDPKINAGALWTVKYAPQTIKEMCGNTGLVEKLKAWLEAWPENLKTQFKKPGKDGWGTFRAVLISGPPGIGKTTSAHLVAKLAGYNIIEMNASDTRSKKLLETQLRSSVDNTVLDGFISGKKKSANDIDLSDRSVLIMDEVDGTSAGDRGGIGALNAMIKKTKVPIICIANDISLQKMKPLIPTTFQLKFRRPDANMIRSRLMTIAFREGMKIDKTAVDQLVTGTQSDIRQIINLLSTWKLTSATMNFDQSHAVTSTRDGNALLTPFALMDKLFGPYSWSNTSGARINDKLEVYFQEFDLLPLFVQENYLKHKYARAGALVGKEAALKKAEITSKAADAISDGDMIDRMIHGTQQHWTLMPVHGMMSTVMPAYHTYGSGGYGGWGGGGGESARAFPSWFGKNSTQGRLQRALTDIQIRMRLKVSGDRREIRQSYIPTLFHRLVDPLLENGNDGIEDVIASMDDYYLTKDEWDAVVELGVGENTPEPILKKIKPATKTAFTRKYNTSDHPIPFHKGTEIPTAKRGAKADTERPDFDEAFEIEAEPEPASDDEKKPKKGDGEIKDKLVKAKKPKAAAAPKGKAAKK